jgi:hypothetical protein
MFESISQSLIASALISRIVIVSMSSPGSVSMATERSVLTWGQVTQLDRDSIEDRRPFRESLDKTQVVAAAQSSQRCSEMQNRSVSARRAGKTNKQRFDPGMSRHLLSPEAACQNPSGRGKLMRGRITK